MANKFDNFSKDQMKNFWLDFSGKTDFRNPILTYGYSKAITENLSNLEGFHQKFHQKPYTFTRARIHSSPRTLFPNVKDLWYPPKEYVKVGRGNLPGNPVFYCSNDPGTSIFEIRPKVGDWITTLQIEIDKEEIDLVVMGITKEEISSFSSLSEKEKGLHEYLEIIFREQVTNGSEYNYYKSAFFIESAIENLDGIMYPSVGSNCKGWNVVFTKEFVDKHARFKMATVHEVVNKNSEYDIEIKCLHFAENYNQYLDLVWLTQMDCPTHKIDEDIYHK